MKTKLLLIIFSLAGYGLIAQEFTFGVSGTSAASIQFNRPVGIYGAYTRKLNQKLKWDIDLLANFSLKKYDRITFNEVAGTGYVINKVQPSNTWLQLSTSLNFSVLSRVYLNLAVGPQISLNYFFCSEQILDITSSTLAGETYRHKVNYLNRPGVGGNIQLELKGLFRKKVTIIASLTPQAIVYGKLFEEGSNVEGVITAVTTRFGVRYEF